jgi:hypothetical protein
LLPYDYGPIRWIERSAAVIALTIVKALLIDMSTRRQRPQQRCVGRVKAGSPGASLVGSGCPYRVEELADLEL